MRPDTGPLQSYIHYASWVGGYQGCRGGGRVLGNGLGWFAVPAVPGSFRRIAPDLVGVVGSAETDCCGDPFLGDDCFLKESTCAVPGSFRKIAFGVVGGRVGSAETDCCGDPFFGDDALLKTKYLRGLGFVS